MTPKKRLKLIISISATIIAVVHLLFPKINIDLITVALIALAIVPWLETLFKSVELPGGVKLEFQELEKLEKEAKEVGLISSEDKTTQLQQNELKAKYDFVEIAEKNQEIALVSLRIEIEKRLREIAAKYSIDTNKYSVLRLIDALAQKNILTLQETTVLKDMISTLNHAAHGVEYDERNAKWVIENGPEIVDNLENKISNRGVIFHGNPDSREHWIDKSLGEDEWITNSEWQQSISKHKDLWHKELENIYQSLLKKISSNKK